MFYVYRPLSRVFLAEDERSWTEDFFEAATFSSRELATKIATSTRSAPDAYVLDDGDVY